MFFSVLYSILKVIHTLQLDKYINAVYRHVRPSFPMTIQKKTVSD